MRKTCSPSSSRRKNEPRQLLDQLVVRLRGQGGKHHRHALRRGEECDLVGEDGLPATGIAGDDQRLAPRDPAAQQDVEARDAGLE